MKTFLIVARDLMSARIQLPVINLMIKAGHRIHIIAEGRAISVFTEAGLTPFFTGDDSLAPFGDAKVEARLREINPDALLIGCSAPINWELEFAKGARNQEIPVIAFSDIWGALKRLDGFVPDLALVIDEAEAQTVFTNRLAKRACVIGDIASVVSTAIADKEKEALLDAAIKAKKHVLIVGDDNDNVVEVVSTVVDCFSLEKREDIVIVPRLIHPKMANNPEVKPIVEKCNNLLWQHRVEKYDGISTDALAARCQYTAASFSTAIRIALHHGKRALSVRGEKSDKLLFRDTGLTVYPLVEQLVVPSIHTYAGFGAMTHSDLQREKWDARAKAWAETAKFRPEVAIEALLAL